MDNRKLIFNTVILDFDGTMCKLFERYNLKQVSKLLRNKRAVMGIDFSDSKDCIEVYYTIAEQTDKDDDKKELILFCVRQDNY